jgi:hypothetical protein
METVVKRGFLRTVGKFAAYSGVAVAGLIGTRYLADIAARGIKTSLPLFPTLFGTWAIAAWATAKWGGPFATALTVGSGIAVIDEGLTYVLPAVGLGPKRSVPRPGVLGACPEQYVAGQFPRPSLFRPAARDACDMNFWRGRWVGCQIGGPKGLKTRRWCHDSYWGQQCCPAGSKNVGMDEWP